MECKPNYVQVCIIEEKATPEMNSVSIVEYWFGFVFYLFLKINSNEQESLFWYSFALIWWLHEECGWTGLSWLPQKSHMLLFNLYLKIPAKLSVVAFWWTPWWS